MRSKNNVFIVLQILTAEVLYKVPKMDNYCIEIKKRDMLELSMRLEKDTRNCDFIDFDMMTSVVSRKQKRKSFCFKV